MESIATVIIVIVIVIVTINKSDSEQLRIELCTVHTHRAANCSDTFRWLVEDESKFINLRNAMQNANFHRTCKMST